MKDLFLAFVRIGIEASALIGIILALRSVFKRVPRAYIYGLWLVALLRLLCPVHIEANAPIVSGLDPVMTRVIPDIWRINEDGVAEPNGGQTVPDTGTPPPVSDKPNASTVPILAALWLAGAGICGAVYVGQYMRLKKHLHTAIRAEDNAWETGGISSPLVMGVCRPRIYLPMGLKGAEREHILAHERMHIRHLDPQVRALGLATLCLHWWNPLVWLAIRLMNQDMEMVCDESVLRAADMAARKAYMQTLLTYSMRQSGLSVTPYFGETNTEKRIRHIMLYKKPTLIAGGMLLLVIIACAVVFFVVPRPDTGSRPDIPVEAEAGTPSPAPVQPAGTPEPEMTYHEYLTRYSGYLDELAMFEGAYDGLDYDGDGMNDRIYREITDTDENGEALGIGYRIDFGNGDTLWIGGFEDVWTAVELIGYDLTGDGVNEIIYCGLHGASTFPPMGSEIAVFTKTDAGYGMLPLPRPDDWETGAVYRTGSSIYSKNVTKTSATLYGSQYPYEERINIDPDAYEYSFKEAGNEPVGSDAWRVSVQEYEGSPALVLYINIGYKYYERDLGLYLVWRDGAFQSVDMRLEPEPETAE